MYFYNTKTWQHCPKIVLPSSLCALSSCECDSALSAFLALLSWSRAPTYPPTLTVVWWRRRGTININQCGCHSLLKHEHELAMVERAVIVVGWIGLDFFPPLGPSTASSGTEPTSRSCRLSHYFAQAECIEISLKSIRSERRLEKVLINYRVI